jgi:LacI family gluconate utilization system Gnt-I transcriptional repressor
VTGRRHSAGALKLLRAAQADGTPVIEIWDHHRGGSGFTQVGFNHDEVGQAMAEHLLRAGHRRIAYVDSGVAEDYRAHERGLAFAGAVRAAGARVDVLVAPQGDAFNAGRHMLGALLAAAAPAVTAAAFANDHLASGALLEAARRRVPVPGRLALLGFGDFAWSRQLDPALSSVALPRFEIGVAAARALLAGLAGRTGAVPADASPAAATAAGTTLSWSLVARESTARR